MSYGIPGFRLPRNITKNLTKKIKDLGINLITNSCLGKDMRLKDLQKQFKAIFIAIGAEISSTYTLTNEECSTIFESSFILKEYNAKRIIKNLGNVIVIGGGNVATDSARAVLRMGASSSTIVYRRNKEKMPAREDELNEAIKDGVKIIYNTKVLNAKIENKKVKEIECIKTKCINDIIEDEEKSNYNIKADTIIFAIGLKPNKSLIQKEGILLNENGLINIDENNMTNLNGIFAGGDSTQNKATVCMAISDGKKVAGKIEKFLQKM